MSTNTSITATSTNVTTSATTKSKGIKSNLDKFYTPAETVSFIINELFDYILSFDTIVEPSAGNGSFSIHLTKIFGDNPDHLPKPNIIAFDISPEHPSIIQADFLTSSFESFSKNTIVIGNPPFGEQSKLAIEFFNHSAKFAKAIAFIVPKSFNKPSIQNRLSLDFVLKQTLPISDKFELDGCVYKVPCVFQLWERTQTPRKKHKGKTTTELFDFVDKEFANVRIQRVGGNAGKASLDLDRSPSSNYFVRVDDPELFVDVVNNAIFPTINDTVGPKSLSKTELIQILEELL